MPIGRQITLKIEHNGQVNLPANLACRYGLTAGASLLAEETERGILLHRSVNVLERVYLEPTNACNLTCRTCMRNIWAEAPGWMSAETFGHVCAGLTEWEPRPTVFFGGFGEPLAHPGLVEMVAQARGLGAPVELITNGILLDRPLAKGLLRAGLRTLWVSLDGVSPQSYQDVRLGDHFERVIANLRIFQRLRAEAAEADAHLGISFVAMKRNIADLPALLRLAGELGAQKINVTNLLAHTDEMGAERLYRQAQGDVRLAPEIELVRLDLDEQTLRIVRGLVRSGVQVTVSGQDTQPASRRCPFLEKASLSIRWDGAVSPCLSLLHSHNSLLGERQRRTRSYVIGNVNQSGLGELWLRPEFVSLRQRLQQFDFSPCVYCNSCEMAEQNLEDCFGNLQPACGGCLWAQGLITCP